MFYLSFGHSSKQLNCKSQNQHRYIFRESAEVLQDIRATNKSKLESGMIWLSQENPKCENEPVVLGGIFTRKFTRYYIVVLLRSKIDRALSDRTQTVQQQVTSLLSTIDDLEREIEYQQTHTDTSGRTWPNIIDDTDCQDLLGLRSQLMRMLNTISD